MLVATPGQTTSYALHGSNSNSSNTSAKICHNNNTSLTQKSSMNSGNSNNNSNTSVANNCISNTLNVHTVARPVVNKLTESSTALMKTLSVRLNRGTEFLKETVQKALINNANTTTLITNNTNSNAANCSYRSIYQNKVNNLTSTALATATATAVNTNFAITTTKHNATTNAALNCASTSTVKAAAATATATATATSTSALNKLHTVPPTLIHRYPEERQHTISTDSLHKEMCHFKPIRSVPTTPWKCTSRSRGGAVLKMPKARLATKSNYNCDDPIPTTKQSNCAEDATGSSSVSAHAEELLSYQFYKPKPSSTVLTTILTTPSHQSAFVCLVAQMKNLVNIQTKQSNTKTGKMLELYKARGRGRPKASVAFPVQQLQKSPLNVPLTQLFLRSRKQPFVQVKKINLPAELIIKKRLRGACARGVASKLTTSASCKTVKNTKSKAILKETKSKMINIIAFAQENNIQSANRSNKSICDFTTNESGNSITDDLRRKQRKRKYNATQLENEMESDESGGIAAASGSESNLQPSPRKSARLSKDCSNEVLHITSVKKITLRKRKTRGITKRTVECFSPPLTRSRLKQMMERKLSTTVESARQRIA